MYKKKLLVGYYAKILPNPTPKTLPLSLSEWGCIRHDPAHPLVAVKFYKDEHLISMWILCNVWQYILSFEVLPRVVLGYDLTCFIWIELYSWTREISANIYSLLQDGSTMIIEASKGGHTAVVKMLVEWPNRVLLNTPMDLAQPDTPHINMQCSHEEVWVHQNAFDGISHFHWWSLFCLGFTRLKEYDW